MIWKADRTKIETLLRNHGVNYKRRHGSGWLQATLCPFCKGGKSGDKYTFAVHGQDGNYACQRGSCATEGSFWKLCEHFGENPRDFHTHDSAPHIAEPKREYRKPVTPLLDLPTAVIEYLRERGFSDETIRACRIRSDKDEHVVFPYLENGESVFLKFRHAREAREGEKKSYREPGGKPVLWGLDQCDPSTGPLVICFGEYDRMAAYEAGVPNTTSVPSGDKDENWINLCWDELSKYEQIILWVDNDEPAEKTGIRAGEQALHKIAPRLGKSRVRVVKSQFKDANEMLIERSTAVGTEAAKREIVELVKSADWYPHDGLIRVSEIGDRPVEVDGVNSGLAPVDRMTGGARDGEVTVHTGDNGSGKTSGLLGFCAASIEENIPVCVWSGELDRYTFRYWSHLHMAGRAHVTEHVSGKTGRTYFKVKPEAERAINRWHHDHYILYDKRTKITRDDVFEAFQIAYQRYGCKTFILDNLMQLLIGVKDVDKLGAQTDLISQAKSFAAEIGCHVHVVAHTNKSGDPLQPPSKNSVSGAKEITNVADNVFAWWKVPQKARVGEWEFTDGLLCILKNRMFGDEVAVKLQYDKDVRRFSAQEEAYTPKVYPWTQYLESQETEEW